MEISHVIFLGRESEITCGFPEIEISHVMFVRQAVRDYVWILKKRDSARNVFDLAAEIYVWILENRDFTRKFSWEGVWDYVWIFKKRDFARNGRR